MVCLQLYIVPLRFCASICFPNCPSILSTNINSSRKNYDVELYQYTFVIDGRMGDVAVHVDPRDQAPLTGWLGRLSKHIRRPEGH